MKHWKAVYGPIVVGMLLAALVLIVVSVAFSCLSGCVAAKDVAGIKAGNAEIDNQVGDVNAKVGSVEASARDIAIGGGGESATSIILALVVGAVLLLGLTALAGALCYMFVLRPWRLGRELQSVGKASD